MKRLGLNRVMRSAFGFGMAAILLLAGSASAASYKYWRVGAATDATTHPVAGIAMMGGGDDLDEAFRWLCNKGTGGDFLVLRAHGKDDYNPYVNGLCKVNSVATLLIPSRKAANDPKVVAIIRAAEVIFISGGDQARYVNWWKGTPVQEAINAHVAAGKPLGGTSAGLAVQGEFAYGALGDKPHDKDLRSSDVLANPYLDRVTLVRGFLKVPQLENLLTDSHFAKRDRMGRTLGFLARILQDGWSSSPREVAIDEKSAVLLEPDGTATVVGTGRGAYMIRPTGVPAMCERGKRLTFTNVTVLHVAAGHTLNLGEWTASGAVSYSLSVDAGMVTSTQADGSLY